MKAKLFLLIAAALLLLNPESGMCANRELVKVTRIETVKAVMKRGKLFVAVEGMAKAKALIATGGRLLPHSADRQLNKDGLLEYDLVFTPPHKEPEKKLGPVRASLKESHVPAGTKGVRIFAEYNQIDGLIPEPKKKKK
ncbi:MAG: hypothetical protein ABJB69_02840 [Spartobacteria bacterium]